MIAQVPQPVDAIVIENVVKNFKKYSKRREYTTLKTEVVRILKGERRVLEAPTHIEALKGVDLRIARGTTVGIIGRNGSGKSTLLKLMTGIYTPTSGRITVHGRISALLELGAGFHPDFTGRENILINGIILGMSRAEVRKRVDTIIEFAELGDFIDEPVRVYSSGMFMRLAFAVATHVDPEVLIVDEILAVGDEHFAKKSQAKMNEFKQSGRTIVLVTHGLGVVEQWCDVAVWIDGGKVRRSGPPREVVAEYRAAVAAAETQALQTGHSALSTPGGALPATPPPPPPPAVPVAAEPAKVLQVRLRDGLGAQPSAFSTEGRLEVLLGYQVLAGAQFVFAVDVVDGAGRLVFGTTYSAGELTPGRGTVRLALPRLGLGEGSYDVVCSVHPTGHPRASSLSTALIVAATPGCSGVARPEHAWSMEPAEGSVAGPAAPAPTARA